jgi:hypothetical protein
MALQKVDYVNQVTVITAENMNDIQDAIIALETAPSQGLSEEVKQALLQLAQKVAYIDDQGQTYYDDLYNAFYPPKTVVSITAVFEQGTTVIYDDTALNDLKQFLTVTAKYDDNTTAILPDASYTLSGTLEAGTSSVTVNYNGVVTSFDVVVTARPTLSSISAVYTQSGTVYDTDSLDSLKSDLVVTATYSDSSTQTVPAADYTLSGTLTAGTSIITVAYGGKTDTFMVSVSAYWDYEWYASSMSAPNGMTFETYDFTTDPGAMRVVSPNLDFNYIGAAVLEVTMRPFALRYNKTTKQYEEEYYSANSKYPPNNPQISAIYSMDDKIGMKIIFGGKIDDVMCTRLLTGGTEVDINDDGYHSFRSVSENGSAKIYVDDILTASGQGFVSAYYEFTGISTAIGTAENAAKYCAYIKSIKFKRL